MNADQPTSEIAHELSLAISRLRARLRGEQTMVSRGLTISQLSALGRVVEAGTITTSDLASAEHVRVQSMAETIRLLRTDELITSTPDPNDGRKKLLSATDIGRALIDTVVKSRRDWLAQAIDHQITATERETLIAATSILAQLADRRDASVPVYERAK
ncbi:MULTISPECIES: MarR family transcriptional regulator [Actinomycetes]|uniref:MarR family winged helix-turn-helix transcriptional regulator n=1 Tax=Actinomycetes TaxID=1760 RepID=UPI000691AAB0|nr:MULTISPECIES: MarR family transcriptional regulator [Actinomycetes]